MTWRTAQQYFNSAIYGDPVEVTGTSIELSYSDGDIWDWAVRWDEWVSMSALSPQAPPTGHPQHRARDPDGCAAAGQRPSTAARLLTCG